MTTGSTTPAWIQRSNQSWQTIQDNLRSAEKMLNTAGELIRKEFERIEQAGTYRMLPNPEMVKECTHDWIIEMVNQYHEGKLTLPGLKQVLAEHDHQVRPLLGEADAKVLSGIIEEVDRMVVERMVSVTTEHLQKAALELQLAKEARDFLHGYRARVQEAYTAGLGPTVQERWVGKYGSQRAEERREWSFADTVQPPPTRSGRKP